MNIVPETNDSVLYCLHHLGFVSMLVFNPSLKPVMRQAHSLSKLLLRHLTTSSKMGNISVCLAMNKLVWFIDHSKI